jgi:hypothetical protein
VKRYIFFPTGRECWFDLAERLDREGVARPVLWLGDRRHDARAATRFADAEIVDLHAIASRRRVPAAAYSGRWGNFWTDPAERETREIAIKLMDRVDHFGRFGNVEREAVFDALVFWAMDRIERRAPDFLLMAESPHAAPQYVMMAVARHAGVPVLGFGAWPLAPVLTLRRDAYGPDLPLSPGLRASLGGFHARAGAAIADYVARFEDPASYGFVPRYMLRQAGRDPEAGRLAGVMRRVARAIAAEAQILLPGRHGAVIGRRRLRRALGAASTDAPHGPYVYFPLHYEPERTTTPDGGAFTDQLRAIARLRALLPRDHAICVKEHPSQFNPFMKGHLGRTPAFYDALRRIEGVHLLPPEASSAALLIGAAGVATITGTVGLEAALLGKRTLVFGHPWFAGCPNTFAHAEAQTDIAEALRAPAEPRDAVAAWLAEKLAACGLPGCINPSNERYFARYYAENDFAALESEALATAVTEALA